MRIVRESDYLVNKDSSERIRYWKLTFKEDNGIQYLITNYGFILGTFSEQINEYAASNSVLTLYEKRVRTKLNNGYTSIEELDIKDVFPRAIENKDDELLYSMSVILQSLLTVENVDVDMVRKPMKAQPFVIGKMNYPAFIQAKLNGYRGTVSLDEVQTEYGIFEDKRIAPVIRTKEGLIYHLPHITNVFNEISAIFEGDMVFDGEVYRHNTILSDIKRRIPMIKRNSTKPSNVSLNPEELTFVIYDLSISGATQSERFHILDELCKEYSIPIITVNNIVDISSYAVVRLAHDIVYSDDEVRIYRDLFIENSFEGAIIRDTDDFYNFGGRKRNMLKAKKFTTSEFEIVDIIKVNEDSRRTYIEFVLKNDRSDLTFNCTPTGDEAFRQEHLNNKHKYIGRTATVKFAERTINDLPFHGNVIDIAREDMGDLDIKDVGY